MKGIALPPVPKTDIASVRLTALCYLGDGDASAPEIAERLDVSRVTVFRALNRLGAEGFVSMERRRWRITDAGREALIDLSQRLAGLVRRIEER